MRTKQTARKKAAREPTLEEDEEQNDAPSIVDSNNPNEQPLTEQKYIKVEPGSPTDAPTQPQPDLHPQLTQTARSLAQRIQALRRARLTINTDVSSAAMTLYPKMMRAEEQLQKLMELLASGVGAELRELVKQAQQEQIRTVGTLRAAKQRAKEHIAGLTETEVKLEGDGEDEDDVFHGFEE